MGTFIKTIKGSKHTKCKHFVVTREKETLDVNTFYNGKVRGKSVQLTINMEYIHLTRKQTNELIKALQKAYKE